MAKAGAAIAESGNALGLFGSFKLDRPEILLIFIPLVIVLFIILSINFVKFEKEDKTGIIIYRVLMFFSRAVITALLVFALAGPYITKSEISAGTPEINILYDNSSSMGLFAGEGYGINADALKKELEQHVPANIKYIAAGTTSMLGDEIFRQLHKKNLLLITDANNDERSMRLKDVVTYAKKFNTTINAIKLDELRPDASISLSAPYTAIVDTEYVFSVWLNNAKEAVDIAVKIDGETVYSKSTGEEETIIKHKFKVKGEHKITAEIKADDLYDTNNRYYHVVDVVDKPYVLYLSDRASYVDNILETRYTVHKVGAMPSSQATISKYYSIVINDKMNDVTYQQAEILEKYTDDENGLVVIGGENSFNRNTPIDMLLPVQRGEVEEKGGNFNFILLLDMSGYISSRIVREELAAMEIINLFAMSKENVKVGIVEFAHIAEAVSELKDAKAHKDEYYLEMNNHHDQNNIEGIPWYRPSEFQRGLKKAGEMLKGIEGNNNIIVVSDGAIREKVFKQALDEIKSLRENGVRIHAFNLKNDEFDDAPLKRIRQTISGSGRGMFMEDISDVKNLFEKNLIISNPNHWITRNLGISGALTRYNSVIPTASADMLVSTGTGAPVITVNAYNKVGVVSTDDGKEWAKDMYLAQNIFIMHRLMDWSVGDPNRKRDEYVRVKDAIVNRETKVEYKGKKQPATDMCSFYPVEDHYECYIIPKNAGFDKILGKEFGVNYDNEYRYIGYNERAIRELTEETGGLIFGAGDLNGMVEKAKSKAEVDTIVKRFLDWYLIIAAMALFLIEVLARRMREKIKKGEK